MRRKQSFGRDSLVPTAMHMGRRSFDPLGGNPVDHGVDEVQIILDACTETFAPDRAPSLSDLHPDLTENPSQHQKELSNHFHKQESASAPDSELEQPTEAEAIHMSFSDVEADDVEAAASGAETNDGQTTATSKTRHRTRVRKGKPQNNIVLQTWLKIDRNGESSILQADKWRLTHKLGVQLRDMRLLDPNMSTAYTSAILCREKAIIVNIEHVKAIITTSYVLVINHEDEKLARFIEDLKRRLQSPVNSGGGGGGGGIFPGQVDDAKLSNADKLKLYLSPSSMGLVLPFELKALEVCLDVMAGHLDYLTAELESAAYPALDALAGNVSSQHLERVRRIKNALVRLTNRVDTLRGLLEKFMDDDGDMHDLNLTAKEIHEEEERQQLAHMDRDSVRSTGRSSGSSSSSSSRSSRSSNSSIAEAETAVVEMLLEAYYMHLDNTYNKLQTLHEYVGDTEDLVNIQLDQHRNQLIFVDMMLTAFTAYLATMSSISGWFGMNLASGLSELPHAFREVVISSNIGGLCLLVGFFVWIYRSGLISH